MRRRCLWVSMDIFCSNLQQKFRRDLDTPVGLMGILVLIIGIGILVTLGQALTGIFRNVIPWVSGSQVASVYWQSITFGIKASFLFILFTVSLIVFLILKFNQR